MNIYSLLRLSLVVLGLASSSLPVSSEPCSSEPVSCTTLVWISLDVLSPPCIASSIISNSSWLEVERVMRTDRCSCSINARMSPRNSCPSSVLSPSPCSCRSSNLSNRLSIETVLFSAFSLASLERLSNVNSLVSSLLV